MPRTRTQGTHEEYALHPHVDGKVEDMQEAPYAERIYVPPERQRTELHRYLPSPPPPAAALRCLLLLLILLLFIPYEGFPLVSKY